MGVREFTKNGAFVAVVLALFMAFMPFALDQIGEATGLFRFPVMKTVRGWFSSSVAAGRKGATIRPVDWERYRRDLEEFTEWADGRSVAVVSHPKCDPAVIEVPPERKSERRIWPVPVTSCTAANPARHGRGYVFVSGFDHPFEEGAMIAPTQDRCGYEVVSVGERSSWFRVVYESEGDESMGIVRFPEFTRIEGDALVRGNRKYAARDAFPLASGGWLLIDSFLPPDGVVFKIIDENYREVTSLLCIVIDEKGDR